MVKDTKLTEFLFLDDILEEKAIYSITLEVSETCETDNLANLVDEGVGGLTGNL